MKRHITQSDYDYTKVQNEVNDLASETVPDQSMTIAEIMKRFARGLPLEGERVPWYEGDDKSIEENGDFPDITRMSKVDRHMLAKDAAENVSDIRKRMQHEAKERAKKKKADQGSKTERTTGEEADQGAKGAPDQINPGPDKNSAGGDEAKASGKN